MKSLYTPDIACVLANISDLVGSLPRVARVQRAATFVEQSIMRWNAVTSCWNTDFCGILWYCFIAERKDNVHVTITSANFMFEGNEVTLESKNKNNNNKKKKDNRTAHLFKAWGGQLIKSEHLSAKRKMIFFH